MAEESVESCMTELSEQPVPEARVFCPECGGEPILQPDEKVEVEHRLSNAGYLHDDMNMRCSECNYNWTHGVPVGEFSGGLDLACDACSKSAAESGILDTLREKLPGFTSSADSRDEWPMFVHRTVVNREPANGQNGKVTLHLKCPRCYYFKTIHRETDQRGVALTGYPGITGNTEEATPYGYDENPPGIEDNDR